MPRIDLSQLDLAPPHLAQLRYALTQHVPDTEVWAFGSRVNGTAHSGSDLDLVLRNIRQLDTPATGTHELKHALQNSMLPMLIDVHDWARLPQNFHEEISRRYIIVQP